MPESRTVHLYGGPYHGQYVAIPVESDHFHIRLSLPQNPEREGTYSQVSGAGNREKFEWDGWRSHE